MCQTITLLSVLTWPKIREFPMLLVPKQRIHTDQNQFKKVNFLNWFYAESLPGPFRLTSQSESLDIISKS